MRAVRLATVVAVTLWAVACGGGGPTVPTGTLSFAPCAIADNSASCDATVTWTTQNAVAPRVSAGTVALASAAAGTAAFALGGDALTLTLYDGDTVLATTVAQGVCVATSDWSGTRCEVAATRSVVFAPTPFTHEGAPVALEVLMYAPLSDGPYPTVMFNHGSTDTGTDPSEFTQTFFSSAVVRYFTRRGWLVAFPQRRGRGQSGGLYDEGFWPDRSGYACDATISLAGFERALDDLDVVVEWLRARPEVDPDRLLSAGISRGGALALVHAAERPGVYGAVLNFVGGWMTERCSHVHAIHGAIFDRAAAYPGESMWIYSVGDSFYSIAHSRANFDRFTAAGGYGFFFTYTRAPGLDGHFIINDLERWRADLDDFLDAGP